MESLADMNEPRTADVLIREMARRQGQPCPDCRAPVCGHQVLMNLALGFRESPRCVGCLAAALDRAAEPFRDHLMDFLQQRECHQEAWAWANRNEAADANGVPACLAQVKQSAPAKPAVAREGSTEEGAASAFPLPGKGENESEISAHAEWDAGDMGCGELVLELRLRLQSMPPGQIMRLRAHDPGAPQDLPAWCRLTGHLLLRAAHPTYWIQRKK